MLLPSSSFTSINVQPPLNRLGGRLAQFPRLELWKVISAPLVGEATTLLTLSLT